MQAPPFWLELIRSAARLVASSPAEPGWVDTKVDAETGGRYGADDPVRGAGTVYSWIQGRALEAAAGHAAYLHASGDAGDAELARALDEAARRALARVRAARAANGGRLFFFLATEGGAPFVLEEVGEGEEEGRGAATGAAAGEPRRVRRRALPESFRPRPPRPPHTFGMGCVSSKPLSSDPKLAAEAARELCASLHTQRQRSLLTSVTSCCARGRSRGRARSSISRQGGALRPRNLRLGAGLAAGRVETREPPALSAA